MDGIIQFITSAAKLIIAVGLAYTAALWFALVVWTYRDIEQRSRSVVTQIFATLLVVLFFVPGAILYYVLRPRETLDEAFQRSLEEEYLLQDLEDLPRCHSCHRAIESDWIVCPSCHTELRHECPNCSHLVRVTWDICPYCATELEPAARADDENGSIGRLMASLRDRLGNRTGMDGKPGEPVYANPPAAVVIPTQQVRPFPVVQSLPVQPFPPGKAPAPAATEANGTTNAPIPFRPATPPSQSPPHQGTEMLPLAANVPPSNPYRADVPLDFNDLQPFHVEKTNGANGNGNGNGAAHGQAPHTPLTTNGASSRQTNGNGHANAPVANGNGANGYGPVTSVPPRRDGANIPAPRDGEPTGPPRRP